LYHSITVPINHKRTTIASLVSYPANLILSHLGFSMRKTVVGFLSFTIWQRSWTLCGIFYEKCYILLSYNVDLTVQPTFYFLFFWEMIHFLSSFSHPFTFQNYRWWKLPHQYCGIVMRQLWDKNVIYSIFILYYKNTAFSLYYNSILFSLNFFKKINK